MNISTSATREKYPLSDSKPIKKTIEATIGWVILFIILLVIGVGSILVVKNEGFSIPAIWSGGAVVILLILLAFVILFNFVYQLMYFKSYFYDFTDGFIVIRKGVVMPREISIPYERVQDVYVDQDLWDRIFGLYDVHLSTATWTSGMEAHIDGVGKVAADGLRDVLLKTIGEKIKKK